MNENFFADYQKFIVEPEGEKIVNDVFDPKNYAAYYILTMSIYDPRISNWEEANKYDINVEKSIKTVLKGFNQNQRDRYHLQLLELAKFKNYFILALSSKEKFETTEENERISFIIDRLLTNPFFVGQNWFNLIGEKGRIKRQLFCCSFKEYNVQELDKSNLDEKFDNISELIPKNGEIKLIKSPLKNGTL